LQEIRQTRKRDWRAQAWLLQVAAPEVYGTRGGKHLVIGFGLSILPALPAPLPPDGARSETPLQNVKNSTSNSCHRPTGAFPENAAITHEPRIARLKRRIRIGEIREIRGLRIQSEPWIARMTRMNPEGCKLQGTQRKRDNSSRNSSAMPSTGRRHSETVLQNVKNSTARSCHRPTGAYPEHPALAHAPRIARMNPEGLQAAGGHRKRDNSSRNSSAMPSTRRKLL
jgi:hypothetical protein